MKHIKKLAALALAIMMLMGLAIPAAAAEGDTITISMTTSANGAGVAGHTYNVYQIFTGDVAKKTVGSTTQKVLSNADFGDNYTPAGKTVQEAMEELSAMSGADAAEFLSDKVTGTPIAILNETEGYSVEVPIGYYLIVDVSEDLPDTETSSAFVLEATTDTEIQSKHEASPTTSKKIDDKNDSTGAEDAIVWHDSADHDIGDEIPFKLEAVIPSTIDAFREADAEYPFTFHDVEETGLTFNGITSVYVLNGTTRTDLSEGDYTLHTDLTDGCTFEVKFADLTAIAAIESGSKLIVEYTSTLNTSAVIGSVGNLNKMRGEFRNYNSPETPDYTPWDSVIAFTYKVVVNKVDENEVPLAGAEFKLEKFVADEAGSTTYKEITGDWVEKTVVKTEQGKVFTFTGLDDGYYRLTETETPDGYNTIDDIYFTVNATHEITWEKWTAEERIKVLKTLTGDVTTGEIEFTESVTDGSLTTKVINESGVVLPETGGTGTTLFYIMGGAMVLVAAILLVTKKRMSNAD